MKNKLLKAGVILAVLAVAVLAMAGAGAADSHTHNGVTFDKAISTADELTSLFTNGGSGYLTADIKGHDFTVSGTVKLCLNGHKIDASNTNYRAIRIDGGSLDLYDCTSSGEITGGKADEGAGVYVSNGTFAMHGGKITSCTANNYGGGVYLADSSTFTMENGAIISGCTANGSGGGVYILDSDSFFSMNGSTISNCKATTGRGGGVHMTQGSTFTMSDSTISGCSADTHGGGVYLAENSLFIMDNGTISGCTADGSGGGVFLEGGYSSFFMNGSTISNCKATTGRSGGVHLNSGSTFTMSDSTISYCYAYTYGGGVRINPGGVFTMSGDSTISYCSADTHGGGVYNEGEFTMNGGTISNNTAAVNGGGVYVTDGAVFTMKSGSITANTGKLGGGVLVNYAVFKMEGGSITGNSATKEGGGVYLANASRYKNTGGTISGNTNGDIINKIHDGWTKIEDEDDLEEFFEDGGYGYLDTKDVFEGDFLIDKYEIDVYLDLNGRQIKGKDRSVSGSIEAVSAIQVTYHATLNLYDSSEDGKGYITGTNTVDGDGAGILLNTGNLYLYTGNVRNCTTPSNGAGVYLDYRSNFYMYSGATIENCTASSRWGGGVKVDGEQSGYRNRFYMYGGTISGCSAANGAGVYATANSFAYIYGGKIINCTADDFGGGIRLFDGSITRYGGYIKDNGPDNIYSDETSEETFNIRYYGIDGAEVSNPATISTGSDITLNNPVKSGYTFTGWIGSNLPEKTMNAVIDCGYGGDRTFIATWEYIPITDEKSLRNAVAEGGNVVLENNITLSNGALNIENDVTLDLNGFTLAGNGTDRVITISSGSLTLTDSSGTGKITNGSAYYGGGVYIENGSSFTMESGTITGCTATYGGGIYVCDDASFMMNGGRITGCSPDAIYISGAGSYGSSSAMAFASAAAADTASGAKVVIKGGIIDGKVIDNGDLEIGGDAEITEIELPSGKQITFLDGDDKLREGASIGIQLEDTENPGLVFKLFKSAYIQKGLIKCKNSGCSFAVDDTTGDPILKKSDGTSLNLFVTETVTPAGKTANFETNTVVQSITFTRELDEGTTVTFISGLDPRGSSSVGYELLAGFRIALNLNQENVGGTITVTADSSYPEGVRVMFFEYGVGWKLLETKHLTGTSYEAYVGSIVSPSEYKKSSVPFAIVQTDEPGPEPETKTNSSSVTSFFGKKDGSDFTFEKAVVITKATLPGATTATVTNTSGSGWYTCNLTTDSISGNGILYFQVPLDVISVKGWTVNDVSVLGCKTTYLTSEGGYAKYSAVITKDGALTIDFEKDAATAAVEKVQEVVEQKKETVEQKQEVAEKIQETVEQKQTAVEQKQTEAKSPFPVLGILAGLGIAGLVALRRH